MMPVVSLPTVGVTLAPRVVVPTTADLVRFAGASSDFHLLHYDQHYAVSRGFNDVIVHGFYKAAMLSEFLLEYAPPGSWMSKLSATYRGVDKVGAPIVLHGTVTAVDVDKSLMSVDLWTESSTAEVTTQCEATLRWGGIA